MPTRAERLAKAEATARERIATEQKRLASIASEQREESRKARDKRRYHVGAWCDEAGLLACEDAMLQALLALCAQITGSADPRATLTACQAVINRSPGTSLDGMATAAQCGGPTCHVG